MFGFAWNWYWIDVLRNLAGHPDVEVVALCDVDATPRCASFAACDGPPFIKTYGGTKRLHWHGRETILGIRESIYRD
jgi:hypothetical protein